MSKDQKAELILGIVALVCIAFAVTMIVRQERASEIHDREIDRLHRYIAELEEYIADWDVREGGAETEPPPPQPVHGEWTFPIAESDYLMLTSPYGYRISPILKTELYHWGVDIAATWRAQIVAVADGVVVEHWPPPDGYYRGHDVYGGMLLIEHADGWRSLYAHMSETRVHTGWEVTAGQVIGRVGSTGRSRGEHLHFELRGPDGVPVNPLVYVKPEGM